ncbi:alpha/beta fold hydrolase [Actinomadura scrupuli]|uniref:alpha/beta fold hydrolase n=1 Tax=Actinomadura scrupuli TaxID=559629 RepID=UPI003D957C23
MTSDPGSPAIASSGAEPVPEEPATRRPPRSWPRRWARRAGLAALAVILVVTLASFGYNALTAHRATPPEGMSYTRAGDVLTRYRTWGSTGSPVVLVHGAFESADTWSRLAPLLARDHRVYALDLTGYGYSDRRGPYTTGHLAGQLLGFLDAMHLGGPRDRPVLVAHSSGAAAAAEATLRAPDRVGGLMFLDGDALATGAGARSPVRYLLIPPYRVSMLRLALRSDWIIRSVYSRQCGPACPRLDRAGLDQWRRPFQVPGAEAGLWDLVAAGVPGVDPARLAGLRAVAAPKAVVFGASDDVFAKDAPAETAARIGAPAPTLIPGAHHLTMISDPAAVAAAVEALAARAR